MENKTYFYEEAFEASLKYFKGDELAARVWVATASDPVMQHTHQWYLLRSPCRTRCASPRT